MESRELRIGNILREKHTGDKLVVLELTNDRITFDYQTFNAWQAEPIPLTEEILLKCGFYKVGDFNFSIIDKIKLYETIEDGVYNARLIVGLNDSWSLRYIKYLHELQNLYFALTGQELEIKL